MELEKRGEKPGGVRMEVRVAQNLVQLQSLAQGHRQLDSLRLRIQGV